MSKARNLDGRTKYTVAKTCIKITLIVTLIIVSIA